MRRRLRRALVVLTAAFAAVLPVPCLAERAPLEEKPVTAVVPTLGELGAGWTTNVIAYLVDPHSTPSEIDYQMDTKTSVMLSMQRQAMLTNSRTGCGMVLFGRGDLVMNSGLFRVYIQRWQNTRALHNEWVSWKMNPDRVLRTHPFVGEDFFWTEEWWRRTLVRNNFVFRRGLFHVVIEAGADTNPSHVLRLATVIDAKIRGRPAPMPQIP
ncbi:MAG: hypothetical protein AB9869_30550 [Verrucomicrobiia bacterium]